MNKDHPAYPSCPLDLETDQIRILNLQSGQWTDTIHCKFHTEKLSDNPKYFALSYVWGEKSDPQKISLHGHDFLVTQNLFIALRRLRTHYSDPLSIWIDAICIDQCSIAERNAQVRRMAEIYSRCQEVLIWLGDMSTHGDFDGPPPLKLMLPSLAPPPFNDANSTPIWFEGDSSDLEGPLQDHLLSLSFISGDIENCPQTMATNNFQNVMSYRQIEQDVAWVLRMLAEDKHLSELSVLSGIEKANIISCHWHRLSAGSRWLSRNRWFTRVWVIQEFLFAQSKRIFFGAVSIPYAIIKKARDSRVNHRASGCCPVGPNLTFLSHFDTFVRKFENMDIRMLSEINSLFLWCLDFNMRSATEDLDRVFALVALARADGCNRPLSVDYGRALREIYLQVSKDFILQFQTLLPLMWSRSKHRCKNIPSWAVDWTSFELKRSPGFEETFTTRVPGFQSHKMPPERHYGARIEISQDNILITKGVEMDTISDRGETRESLDPDDTATVMNNWINKIQSKHNSIDQYQPGRGLDLTWEDAFVSSLCTGDKATSGIQARPIGKDDLNWFKAVHCSLPKELSRTLSPDLARTMVDAFSIFGERQAMVQSDYILFTTLISQRTHRRRIFLTTKDYIGLANQEIEVGDKIFLLLGGNHPIHVILRPVEIKTPASSDLQTYRVAGEAYIVGSMNIDVSQYSQSDIQTVKIA